MRHASLPSAMSRLLKSSTVSQASLTGTDSRAFAVFRDQLGRWCARRADGLVGGLFVDHAAARKFVRHELARSR